MVPGASLFEPAAGASISMFQRVSLSWFHVPSRRFLGRTFVTQPVPVCFSLTEDYSIKNLQFDEMIYLKTNVCDPDLAIAVELILEVECVSERKVVLKHHDCTIGWGLLKVFMDYSNIVADPRAHVAEVLDVPIFAGSARMLLCALPPQKSKNKASLNFRFGVFQEMQPAIHLMAADTMYSKKSIVPGLYRLRGYRLSSAAAGLHQGTGSDTSFDAPALAPTGDLQIQNPKVFGIGQDTELRLLDELRQNHSNFLDVAPADMCVLDRRLRVGIHNSHLWVTQPFSVSLHRQDDNSLMFEGAVSLHNCPRDPYCVLGFEIWFTVGSSGDMPNAAPRSPGAAAVGHRVMLAFNVQVVCDGAGFLFDDLASASLVRGPRRGIGGTPVYGGAALRTDPELCFSLVAPVTATETGTQQTRITSHGLFPPNTRFSSLMHLHTGDVGALGSPSLMGSPFGPSSPFAASPSLQGSPEQMASPGGFIGSPEMPLGMSQYEQFGGQAYTPTLAAKGHPLAITTRMPVVDPIVGGNLSRADRARLFDEMKQPFREIRRGPTMGPAIIAAAASQHAGGDAPVRFNVNVRCVAFSPNSATPTPKHIYLTYSFYTFDEALLAPEAAGDTFHILMPVVTEGSNEGRGWAQSFSLNCTGREAERHWFADHLSKKHLEIQVWDAASQMELGCARIMLRDLCRGDNAQLMYESDVLNVSGQSCGSLQAVVLKSTQKLPPSLRNNEDSTNALPSRQTKQLTVILVDERPKHVPCSVEDQQAARKASRLEAMRQRQLDTMFKKDAQPEGNEMHTQMLKHIHAGMATRQALKASLVSQAIARTDIVHHTVSASAGRCNFFECRLTNPYLEDSVFAINFEDSELEVVTDASEWCTHKAVASLTTPLENKMLWSQEQTGVRLYLQAKETVYVPFKLQRYYRHSLEHDLPQSDKEPHTTTISFELLAGDSIAQVSLEVLPLGPVIDRRCHFFAAEKEQFVAEMPLPPDVAMVRCGHPGVRAEMEPSELQGDPELLVLRYRCAAATAPPASPLCVVFLVHLYSDEHGAMLSETWKVSISVLQRVHVTGRVGEVTAIKLPLPRSPSDLDLCTFSSVPSLVTSRGNGNLKLSANSDGFAHLDLLCQSPAGVDVVVNVVDLFSRQCFARFLVSVTSNMPTIKDTYELDVASHTGARRKVKYTNPYDTSRIFHVATDRPDLLQLVRTDFEFGPRQTHLLGLMLTATNMIGPVNIYIFVNDDDGQNEDCLLLTINYF